MSDGTLPQLSASSPTDSESFDISDELYDPHVTEEPLASDPSWVARPRNAFIIFRCQYAQRHAKMGRGVKRGTGTSEKSLSKRAAEAWHQLPSEEKNHFKALADQERLEHARLHPDYRFRPAKRILPQRTIRPRPVSSSNIIKERTINGPAVKPKRMSSRAQVSMPTSMYLPDFSPQVTCESLYPYSSSHRHASFSNSLSCEVAKVEVHSADLDSCNLASPLYSHLEGVLPPLPQHGRNIEPCLLKHPMPKCATASTPLLTDWDDIATDNFMTCPNLKERSSPTVSGCLLEDPYQNTRMDMQNNSIGVKDTSLLFTPVRTSPHEEAYSSHLEYICSDLVDIYYPTMVSSHPQSMLSSYFPITH